MSTALRRPMSLEQFLVWEEQQELRYEFDGFQAVAMTGGTVEHEVIGGTLRALLHDKLRGSRCRVYGPTIKIEVAGRIRYPDAFVSCGPVERGQSIIPNPVVVFEVLSASTSRTDRIEKLKEYQATPSIKRYIILEQDSVGATAFARLGADWSGRPLTEGDVLRMPEIGVEIPLSEIYADVPMPAPQPGEASEPAPD